MNQGLTPLSSDTAATSPFSFETRERNLTELAANPVDLLVVGGGITGAGIARDAAMRGLKTALIDKGDFGSGTSSRSSRLVHGGLRYLEHGHLRLVFEASRERRILLKTAPHLVEPRSFLFPIYKGGRVSKWKLWAGLWLYDLLATFRNVQTHRMLGKRSLLKAEPGLKERGLTGGARYYDAQCDDARLTLATVRSAHRHGAIVANYARADRLEIVDGRVRGARVTDLPSGSQFIVRALVVANATGPWSDSMREQLGCSPALRPTKGVHALVPRRRLGNREALTIMSPVDGRVMFVIPWGDLSYIGTTDTDTEISPDELAADASDIVYLLRSANALFPNARLTQDDVVATWAALRPLLKPPDTADPGAVSREHRILEDPSGLLSIVGGKLTTYRVMAADMVDRVVQVLSRMDGRPLPEPAATDKEPLPGGEVHDLAVLIEDAEQQGFSHRLARHLVRAHGSEAPAVIRLAQTDPELAKPIVPGHAPIAAELVHAIQREMAMTLGDLLIRRTHVFYEAPAETINCLDSIAALAAGEMGWDDARREAELIAYRNEIDRMLAFRNG